MCCLPSADPGSTYRPRVVGRLDLAVWYGDLKTSENCPLHWRHSRPGRGSMSRVPGGGVPCGPGHRAPWNFPNSRPRLSQF